MALFDKTDYQIITRNTSWYKLLRLELPELAYFYYRNDNQLVYILFPGVHRARVPTVECYEIFPESGNFEKNTNKEIIKELAFPYMRQFLNSCRRMIAAVEAKIAFAVQNDYSYNIIVPKMGAYVLYLLFHSFYGVTWQNTVYVDYSRKSDASQRKNMRAALAPYLKDAFHGNKKGYALIIIDEFVSGSSIDTIFKDFLLTLDEDLGIYFEGEKEYYYNLLIKKYHRFFRKKEFLRKEIELQPEYAYYYATLIDFINGRIPAQKAFLLRKSKKPYDDCRDYNRVYSLELKECFSLFKEDFFQYLTSDEQREFISVVGRMTKAMDILEGLLAGDISTNKQKIVECMNEILGGYRKIIDIGVKDSLITIAINRRVYAEWMAAFNINIFFITMTDISKYNEDVFKTKLIYYDLFKRNLLERFSSVGIPTMDILTESERIELQKINGLPTSLEAVPNLNEIFVFLRLFVD